MNVPKYILPVIVIAQFCCTSLWFAGNAVMADFIRIFGLMPTALGHLTAAVQLGFIAGTLLFAFLTIADRFSPTRVFFLSALLGAGCNLGVLYEGNTLVTLASIRFLTGFFLAGIYPVGMKIAADYFEKGLGKSLGFLVGALVLGTALPHLLKGFTTGISWQPVIFLTSGLALAGGLLMLLLVPDGPYRKPGTSVDNTAFFKVFHKPAFRATALGYFGHMWELYAFWAFVPVILTSFQSHYPDSGFNIALLSFLIIGVGGPGCVVGGYVSQLLGTKPTAALALGLSCLCCLVSPLVYALGSAPLFIGFLIFWGIVVVADSPLFSTLVAQNSLAHTKGTALTIVNCIGFTITIASIQLLNFLRHLMNVQYIYMVLALGPVLGLIALYQKKDRKSSPGVNSYNL